jgi:acetyl esterase/lipase
MKNLFPIFFCLFSIPFADAQNAKPYNQAALLDRSQEYTSASSTHAAKIRREANKTALRYEQEEFIYGRKDGMGLTLVRIKPKVKSNGKAIISVVSGNWNSGYNGIEVPTDRLEQYLAKGFTVFATMHGSQPRFAIPDQIEDLRRAVRFIRYNAARFGIDSAHIGITGSSSGGHLSLMVATADDNINTAAKDPVDRVSSRVQAVAVLYPPTDMLNWGAPGRNLANAKEQLKMAKVWGALNYTRWNENYRLYEEVADTAARNIISRSISPFYAVSADDPPVFIIHGDADPTVPLQQTQSIMARFKEVNVANQVIIKIGGKHHPDDMNPEAQTFADWFEKYLR